MNDSKLKDWTDKRYIETKNRKPVWVKTNEEKEEKIFFLICQLFWHKLPDK